MTDLRKKIELRRQIDGLINDSQDVVDMVMHLINQYVDQQHQELREKIAGVKKTLEPETNEMFMKMIIGDYMEIVKRNNKKKLYNQAIDDILQLLS